MCDMILEEKAIRKWQSIRDSAKKRNKEFALSIQSVKNLIKAKHCYYSGLELTEGTLTVDRKDNSKGYVKGNVVACHSKINALKSDLTISQIKKLARKL